MVEASAEIVINEIHFDPENGALPGEFIELYNPGSSAVDLSAWFFEDGIDFTLPGGTRHLVPATTLSSPKIPRLPSRSMASPRSGPWVGKLGQRW